MLIDDPRNWFKRLWTNNSECRESGFDILLLPLTVI